jgi:hypothetical protein
VQSIPALCIPSQNVASCPGFAPASTGILKIAVIGKSNPNHFIMKKTWILLTACVLVLAGLILQFTIGGQFGAGDFSCNYFAAGDFACGVFAAGKFSIGIFSIGIFSIGIFSIGIFNIGLYAMGIFILGWKKQLPRWQGNTMQG